MVSVRGVSHDQGIQVRPSLSFTGAPRVVRYLYVLLLETKGKHVGERITPTMCTSPHLRSVSETCCEVLGLTGWRPEHSCFETKTMQPRNITSLVAGNSQHRYVSVRQAICCPCQTLPSFRVWSIATIRLTCERRGSAINIIDHRLGHRSASTQGRTHLLCFQPSKSIEPITGENE